MAMPVEVVVKTDNGEVITEILRVPTRHFQAGNFWETVRYKGQSYRLCGGNTVDYFIIAHDE